GVIDSIADLTRVVERRGDVERPAARQNRFQRLAGHELHHDEEDVLLLLGRQNRDDVGMVQRGEEARLAEQLAEVRALAVGDLERNLLVNPGVLGEVDRAESAAADRRQDLVLADDLAAEEHARVYPVRATRSRSLRPRAGADLPGPGAAGDNLIESRS